MTIETNLINTIEADGGRCAVAIDGRVDALVTKSGRAVAWRAPASAEPGSVELHHAARLSRIAIKADAAIAAINADETRSDAWKATEAARIAEAARAEFAAARAEADKIVDDFAAADSREAAPPVLAAADYNGGLIDQEVRSYVRTLDAQALNAFAQTLLDGKDDRALLAIARSPLPLPNVLAQTVPAALVDMQTRSDPVAARLRRDARERVDFLRRVIGDSANALPVVRGTREQQINAARDAAIADAQRS